MGKGRPRSGWATVTGPRPAGCARRGAAVSCIARRVSAAGALRLKGKRPAGVRLGGEGMPRRVYLLGVGLALVALALAFTDWALSLRPGVTEANVKRIRPGMTLTDVEALMGCPPLPWGKIGTGEVSVYYWMVDVDMSAY